MIKMEFTAMSQPQKFRSTFSYIASWPREIAKGVAAARPIEEDREEKGRW